VCSTGRFQETDIPASILVGLMRHIWIITVSLGAILLAVCSVAWPAPQDQEKSPSNDLSEYVVFQAADMEKNAQHKIDLLNDFTVKYPESKLKPQIYRDYYVTYLLMKDYGQTIKYADKYLASGDSIDLGDRLEALTDRAQAFFAGCGDTQFQTAEAYSNAKVAAAQGLQTVSQYPISSDCMRGVRTDRGCLVEREHVEALFYAVAEIADSGLKGEKSDSCILTNVRISNIKLFSWKDVAHKKVNSRVNEFREMEDLHLVPSSKFDVICEVSGAPDLAADDFFLWTAIDFLVAPVTPEYDKMQTDQLGLAVGWGQLSEMQDLKFTPIYSLRPDETRRVVVKDFDLAKVLAAFPVGDAGNLWPWLMRLEIYVQDRNGKQIAAAQRIVRLSPDQSRKATKH
jgi:hypothetical protein